MTIDLHELADRAADKSEEEGDYWARAAEFLRQVGARGIEGLTRKQKNWLHGLRQDLAQPWE
jgi:hypothetical protein